MARPRPRVFRRGAPFNAARGCAPWIPDASPSRPRTSYRVPFHDGRGQAPHEGRSTSVCSLKGAAFTKGGHVLCRGGVRFISVGGTRPGRACRAVGGRLACLCEARAWACGARARGVGRGPAVAVGVPWAVRGSGGAARTKTQRPRPPPPVPSTECLEVLYHEVAELENHPAPRGCSRRTWRLLVPDARDCLKSVLAPNVREDRGQVLKMLRPVITVVKQVTWAAGG